MTASPQVCPQCQKPLLPNAKFCVKCGKSLKDQASAPPADEAIISSTTTSSAAVPTAIPAKTPPAQPQPRPLEHSAKTAETGTGTAPACKTAPSANSSRENNTLSAENSQPADKATERAATTDKAKPAAPPAPVSQSSKHSCKASHNRIKFALGGILICAGCFYGGNELSSSLAAKQDIKTVCAELQTAAQADSPSAQLMLATLQRYGLARANSPDETANYLASAVKDFPQAKYQLACWQAESNSEDFSATIIPNYQEAAQNGSTLSMLELSRRYFQGYGLDKNDRIAIDWLNKAALAGNVTAQCQLGQHYALGDLAAADPNSAENVAISQDDSQAELWLLKAANQGSQEAKYHLSCLYCRSSTLGKNSQGLELLNSLAEAGYAPAQYELGCMYLSGKNVAKDSAKASEWLQKSAQQNYADALGKLGLMHLVGNGAAQNTKKALEYLRQGALLGSAAAQSRLGLMYLQGSQVNKNYRQAYKLLSQAADQGDAQAQYYAACMCDGINGKKAADPGIPKDIRNKDQALKWLLQSAQQGRVEAQLALGQRYRQGKLVFVDGKQAEHWYSQALKQGSPDAMWALADMYEKGDVIAQDGGKAVDMYTKAAQQGHAKAMNRLGELYEKGKLVERDPQRALSLYAQAAKQGNFDAKCHMGDMYAKGQGVPKDLHKARSLYEQAAKQGNAHAMYCLGNMYEKGRGVTRNIGKALDYYESAAKQKDTDALAALAALYYVGEVVPLNVPKSIDYYNAAAKRGHVASMGMMAHFYETGEGGITPNFQKAVEMYEQAAEHGDTICQFVLGTYYEQGRITVNGQTDYREAFKYYKQAALAGENRAKFKLGSLYAKGLGVDKDRQAAVKWIKEAANAGNKEALAWIDERIGHNRIQEAVSSDALDNLRRNPPFQDIFLEKSLNVSDYLMYHNGEENKYLFGAITNILVLASKGSSPIMYINISDGKMSMTKIIVVNDADVASKIHEGDAVVMLYDPKPIKEGFGHSCMLISGIGHVECRETQFWEPAKVSGWEDLLK